jgi:hypothetical protein
VHGTTCQRAACLPSSGEPFKPAQFFMRVELLPGYMRLPCGWPNDEHVVVLADTLNVGTGCTFDKTAVHDFFIPHSRRSSTVSIQLVRYTAISGNGGSTTIVTQAARPACIPPHNSRLRARPRPTSIDGQASEPSQTRCSEVLRRLVGVWTIE